MAAKTSPWKDTPRVKQANRTRCRAELGYGAE